MGVVLRLEEDIQFGNEDALVVGLVDLEGLSDRVKVVGGSFLGLDDLGLGSNNSRGGGEGRNTSSNDGLLLVEENTAGGEVCFSETFDLGLILNVLRMGSQTEFDLTGVEGAGSAFGLILNVLQGAVEC